jgi:hypothetical protein
VFRIDTALVTLAGITVADGKATGSCAASNPPSPCAEGAGILVNGPTQFDPTRGLTLIDSTVRGNSAVGTPMGTVHGQGTGGGIAAFNGTLTIVNSTITGNQATCTGSCPGGGGAGIQVDFETVSITNSTIAGNVAGDSTHQGFGGGIDSGQTRQTLRSTTISGNTAAGPAGTGGNIKTNPGDRYNFKNSIVANGTAAVGPSCTLDPTMMPAARITSSGYNIDSLDQCSFHAAGDLPKTNPQLGPLADNGGQTDTLALSAASPAVDAASPDCPPPIADQRGLLRPQGIACDIGAFERAQSSGGRPGPGGGGAPATAALTALKIKPSVFPAAANGGSIARRRARRTGTTISYRDSRVGTAMFTVLRPAKGIRDKRRRCVVPKKGRRGARCTRYLSVGTFTHVDRAGANSFHFTGRVRRRKLSPGSYRLQAVPRANGRNGKAVTVSFRIVK